MRGLAALRPLVVSIRRSNSALAEQLARAATHVAVEVLNAEQWHPRSKRRHWLAALASTCEAMVLVRTAVDAGYCSDRRSKRGYVELGRAYLELLKLLKRVEQHRGQSPGRRVRGKRTQEGRRAA
jgi:hypothetical protein